ncbi:MAG: protein kinase [Deltaproteobacteria bacterium]|nr:protein kinase [Deltaproteobacteria bacterium]
MTRRCQQTRVARRNRRSPAARAVSDPFAEPSGEPAELSRGQLLGPYVLEEHLASGGMGEVWRARREGPGGYQRPVALKRIHPRLTSRPDHLELFLREARLGAQLSHPNIVPVIDVSVAESMPYLVMELVEGIDLRRLMSRGEDLGCPLPPTLCGYVVHQVLWALEEAHNFVDASGQPAPIIHRDISPENVLIGCHGEVRVADFGLAKQLKVEAAQTRADEIKGKLSYMAPEQLDGSGVTPATDLYALGVVFYELLTGQRPHQVTDLSSALALATRQVRHPKEVRSGLPDDLAELALRWCDPRRDRREACAASARNELQSALELRLHGIPAIHLAAWARAVAGTGATCFLRTASLPPVQARPCAKCGGMLLPHPNSNGIVIDCCHDCGGQWLDVWEINRILGRRFVSGGRGATQGDQSNAAALDAIVGECPRCRIRLTSHRVAGTPPFHIEQCANCLGLWFDAGELELFLAADLAELVQRVAGMQLAT